MQKELKPLVRQIALEIYGGCNYKCPMCPQATGRERDFLSKMPFETFKKVVDEAVDYGLEVVSLQGSGEPTLHPDMPKFVEYVKKKGIRCITLTNGFRLSSKLSQQLISAGLDALRISAIGYDRLTYLQWMSKDAYDLVRKQVLECGEIKDKLQSNIEISLYHLVLDPAKVQYEVEQYRNNWIDYTNVPAEIWMMHNWGGSDKIVVPYLRDKPKKRSCGRPDSPYLTVRAGGNDGHVGAVVPCCYVLGQDSKAVLGHLDTQTIKEVWNGTPYQELRAHHASGNFDAVDYCKNCDQLYDSPESLVWTNMPGKAYGQSKYLTDLDYRDYVKSA